GDSVELETDLGTVTPVVDNDDGTYTATFSSTASGTATIAGKLNGQEIASFVEVEVLPGPADAEQSIMETSASSITTDDSATITVRLKDAHGNSLTAGGDSVELATDLGTLSPVVDQGDGTYTAAFSATTPGTATISGKVNGAAMSDTVVINVSVGAADAGTSTITADPETITTDDDTALITVQVKDAKGNNLPQGGEHVVLETDHGRLTDVEDRGDGTYTAVFSADTPGTAVITGTLNGQPIGRSAQVTVLPGLPDPQRTALTAEPETAYIGAEGARITVRLYDAMGNPRTAG